jgi:hypothetical protein
MWLPIAIPMWENRLHGWHILAKEIAKNVSNSKDDAYKSLRFVYNKKIDSIVAKWDITSSEIEEQTTLPPTPCFRRRFDDENDITQQPKGLTMKTHHQRKVVCLNTSNYRKTWYHWWD